MKSDTITPKQNKNTKGISLNAEELKKLNASFVAAGIKWIAMFKGIWAHVQEVKNGQVTIQATFPKQSTEAPDPDLIINIFLHCKAFNFIDRVNKLFIIMYKDEGAAGGILPSNCSQEDLAELKSKCKDFGAHKVHIGERLYNREELQEKYTQISKT